MTRMPFLLPVQMREDNTIKLTACCLSPQKSPDVEIQVPKWFVTSIKLASKHSISAMNATNHTFFISHAHQPHLTMPHALSTVHAQAT